MKPTLLPLKLSCCLLLLALTGCTGDPDRAQIVGHWQIATADRLMEQVNAQPTDSSPPTDTAENSVTEDYSADQPPRMLIQFHNSGYLVTQTNMGNISTQKHGHWKFLSFDDQTRTAKIQCKLVDDTTDFDVIIEDENTLRLVPPNMAGLKKKIKFVRHP